MKKVFLKVVSFKKAGLFALVLFLSTVLHAQTQQDVQLALEYFKNGEFEKSAVMYEKLYTKAPDNTLFSKTIFKVSTH